MTTSNSSEFDPSIEARMRKVVGWYTLLASGTGAIPLPASSAAIIAEDCAMITHLSAICGQRVSLLTVFESMGVLAAANLFGKTLFIEIAKLLGWGTASPWLLAALCGVGAATAGLQTYIIGLLSIEILKNGNAVIPRHEARNLIEFAKRDYENFLNWGRSQNWTERPV